MINIVNSADASMHNCCNKMDQRGVVEFLQGREGLELSEDRDEASRSCQRARVV
jgi:hypothetical protein